MGLEVHFGQYLTDLRMIRLRLSEESSKAFPDQQVVTWAADHLDALILEVEAWHAGRVEAAAELRSSRVSLSGHALKAPSLTQAQQ